MPATSVDDITTLRRIPPVAPEARPRQVRHVSTAPRGFEGEGFPVRRAFAGIDLRDLDPFIHMDQIGEVEYAPGEPKGTPWHPHRGFETVTYIIDGQLRHEDSTGGGGLIADGDTQWMTAGSGILHIETPPDELVMAGGLFHGLQLWVNLPKAEKLIDPRYQDLRGEEVVLLASGDGGALVRLIAGRLAGATGPGSTRTPITMVHATVSPGAELVLPWPIEFNGLAYALAGQGTIGPERRPLETGQLAVLGAGEAIVARASASQHGPAQALELLVLGGRPIREPVAWMGPFVMSNKAEIQQALDDFQAGRLGRVPPVHATPTDEVRLETDAALD
jgi:redox-sensitive bicupin YhaK (pirin superfamily)